MEFILIIVINFTSMVLSLFAHLTACA